MRSHINLNKIAQYASYYPQQRYGTVRARDIIKISLRVQIFGKKEIFIRSQKDFLGIYKKIARGFYKAIFRRSSDHLWPFDNI